MTIAMPDNEEVALAIAYAPRRARPALAILFRLDERLGGIVATTTQPGIGAIRLAWWREALEKLDTTPPPAEPLLADVAAHLLPAGVFGTALGQIADGWGALLAESIDAEALAQHAEERGATLFAAAATLLGRPDADAGRAGELWALVDAAVRLPEPARGLAIAAALATAERVRGRLPRPLAMLAAIAASDARRSPDARLTRARRLARLVAAGVIGR